LPIDIIFDITQRLLINIISFRSFNYASACDSIHLE